MTILSIQSAVVAGHVGNAAAVFPLQRLGCEVWPINTVLFSNHPGHGGFAGRVYPGADTRDLVGGLRRLDLLGRVDAVLSGYVGDLDTAAAILDAVDLVRAANPKALYCCDPVIGDDRPGVYVRPGIAEHFRERAVPAADILTPNRFELALLAGEGDPGEAAHRLRLRMREGGRRIVLVSSVHAAPDAIDLVAASDAGIVRVRTPLLPVSVNGSGDLLAALFLHHLLVGCEVADALSRAAASVFAVVERTWRDGGGELRLVAAQDEIVAPTCRFRAEPYEAACPA